MSKKDVLIILILLFVFVVAWIGSNIYHSARVSTISEATNQDISPITPSFDTKTIDKLKERQKINPSFELGEIISSPSSTSLTLPTKIASPQNASAEGTLKP